MGTLTTGIYSKLGGDINCFFFGLMTNLLKNKTPIA